MSKDIIKKIAIIHFNQFGYEGTSLSRIAEEVGMRKQSISYHFPNKKCLFEAIFNDAIEEEIKFTIEYFNNNSEVAIDQKLYDFLTIFKQRFQKIPNVRFMLTMSFLSPREVAHHISAKMDQYMETYLQTVENCFQNQTFRINAKHCAMAYVSFQDALAIKLIYTSENLYEVYQEITWDVFWKGIQK